MRRLPLLLAVLVLVAPGCDWIERALEGQQAPKAGVAQPVPVDAPGDISKAILIIDGERYPGEAFTFCSSGAVSMCADGVPGEDVVAELPAGKVTLEVLSDVPKPRITVALCKPTLRACRRVGRVKVEEELMVELRPGKVQVSVDIRTQDEDGAFAWTFQVLEAAATAS